MQTIYRTSGRERANLIMLRIEVLWLLGWATPLTTSQLVALTETTLTITHFERQVLGYLEQQQWVRLVGPAQWCLTERGGTTIRAVARRLPLAPPLVGTRYDGRVAELDAAIAWAVAERRDGGW